MAMFSIAVPPPLFPCLICSGEAKAKENSYE